MLKLSGHANLVFWRWSWACALALTWLFPPHERPWLSFFSDAWLSTLVLLAAVVVVASSREALAVTLAPVIVLVVALLPWLQYATGLLPFQGYAWIYSLFLAGFALAMVLGAHWERLSPHAVADVWFFALALAAVLSVGLQWYQLLDGDHLGMLVMSSPADRPFANMAQPNQLASLLLLGLLGLLWAWERGVLHAGFGVAAAIVLLVGLVLTGSRAAYVGMVWILVGMWWRRGLWRSRTLPLVATVLALIFVGMLVTQDSWLSVVLTTAADTPINVSSELGARLGRPEVRVPMWVAMGDAILRQPWFGYGVGQGVMAQMAVALQHGNLIFTYSYAHNLIIDLWVWFGLPIGSVIAIAGLAWLVRLSRHIADGRDGALLLAVVVLCNHALFEMPLYYAYFLLPLGMFLGVLQARVNQRTVVTLSGRGALTALATLSVVWGGLVRDYAELESGFRKLELTWHRIALSEPLRTPNLWMLDQWAAYFDAMLREPQTVSAPADWTRLEQSFMVYPTPRGFWQLASTLTLNQQPERASQWLLRSCKAGDCSALKVIWTRLQQTDPRYQAVPWPGP